MILSIWPGKDSGRKRRVDIDYALDGQIHVIPLPAAYQNLNSFRRVVLNRGLALMKKVETCTAPEYPGALIVRCVGPLGEDD